MTHRIELTKALKSQLKSWKGLKKAKIRRQEGFFLAEGSKVLQELWKSAWKVKDLLVMEKKRDHWEAFLSGLPYGTKIYCLTASQWENLSQDKESEGLMAVVQKPRQEGIEKFITHDTGNFLLLYEINNPNNLGALLRTAHWFGFRKILLSSGSVDFSNPKVVRASMGSLFHMNILADVNFAEVLTRLKKDCFIIGSHAKKGVIPHICTGKTAILLGSESHGIPETLIQMVDELWSIPGAEEADSLSLPQAAAIMMYECAYSQHQIL